MTGSTTNNLLAPVNSVLTTEGVNTRVTSSNTNVFEPSTSTTLFGKKNDFASVTDPNQPLVLADATVALKTALTFDETGNFVNVIFQPLTLWETAGANAGSLRADYHLTETSAARERGQAPNNNNSVPTTDIDGEARPFAAGYDVGADEYRTQPILAVSPSTLTFGNVSVNTTATQVVTVVNTGLVPALVRAPTLGTPGANANQFGFTNNCPASLSSGSSCTISVRFTPTSTGGKAATLSVNTSNVGSATVSLSGNGVTPIYTITPLIANFGNQRTGTPSEARQFTLTNTALSQGELWVTGIPTVSGTHAVQFQAAFRAGDSCTSSTHLAVGASCTFSVVFAPTTNGCKWATAPFLGTCLPGVPLTDVDVPKASGNGGGGGGVGGVAGTTTSRTVSGTNPLNFGTVARGITSTQTLTLTNTGFNLIPFTSATFSGANAANWVQTNTCSAGIPVNGSCTVSVVFSPLAAGTTGAKSATLTIVDGVGTTTRTVNGTAN
jgi:hypothetical protein